MARDAGRLESRERDAGSPWRRARERTPSIALSTGVEWRRKADPENSVHHSGPSRHGLERQPGERSVTAVKPSESQVSLAGLLSRWRKRRTPERSEQSLLV